MSTVEGLTDEEKEAPAHIARENALAETSIRLGVLLCRQMGIDPVATLGDILHNVVQERHQVLAESTAADEDNSMEENPPAHRSGRTSVASRKKGKAHMF
ncbi:hypothetical protein AC1031_016228 [Aphanomyces cochlioides]|nr:hypothetical protein AC1031_016228 [Aphanomyces cochlioides]